MNFYFKLEFSSQGVSAELLNDLVSQVLRHIGSSLDAVPDVMPALHKAVATGTAGIAGPADQSRRCDVQFRAHGGTLDILVSANGGRIWQTSLPIA
jgi:hypothetical protein